MSKKIFLDSGIIISLGILNDLCIKGLVEGNGGKVTSFYHQNAKEIEQIPEFIKQNREKIAETLQKESINLLDQDIDNLCNLYIKIMNKEIQACVCPFVYKEICIDPKIRTAEITKNFFNNYCYLAFPKEDQNLDLFVGKTLYIDERLSKIDVVDQADSSVRYGLAASIHQKQNKSETDLNYEDRWIVAQVDLLSELGEKNVSFIQGNMIEYTFTNYTTHMNKPKTYHDLVLDLYELTKLYYESPEIFEEAVKNLKPKKYRYKRSGDKILFLHQNEMDFGRAKTSNRTRKYHNSREKFVRDEDAMNIVAEKLNAILKNSISVSPNSEELTELLSNESQNTKTSVE